MNTLGRHAGVFAVLVAVASCGGTTVANGPGGGAGGSAGGGSGGSAGTSGAGGASGTGGGLLDECAVPSSTSPPYALAFRFTNNASAPLYLREQCMLEFEVRTCADGYDVPLVLTGECTEDCADPDAGCIDCGACQDIAREVPPGASVEYPWAGYWYSFEQRPGCACHVTHPALPGKYRVSVPVWDVQFDPYQSVPPPARVEDLDFELDASGYLDVPLAP